MHVNVLGPATCIEVRLWKQGRVNMESLKQKLKQAIEYSFWDFVTEYHLLTFPLIDNCIGILYIYLFIHIYF